MDVIVLFQGDPKVKTTRYAGLNMMNLLIGGPGTIEVRIKHSSSSSDELVKWVELLSKFMLKSINSVNVFEMLNQIAPTDRLKLVTCYAKGVVRDATVIHQLVSLFFRWLGDEDVARYWMNHIEKMNPGY
jgi:predicted P-loop ATPase